MPDVPDAGVHASRPDGGRTSVQGPSVSTTAGTPGLGCRTQADKVMPSDMENQHTERWVFEYAVHGDLRFISHHDTLRLFHRALARADLPVHYSQGFNPHPSVSIPLPRPVGLASEAEAVVIRFDGIMATDDLLSRLAAQMPAGLTMRTARRLPPGEKLHPELVRYRLDIESADLPELDERIAGILTAACVSIERRDNKSGRTRTIDVRPYIKTIERRGSAIEFALLVTESGTVRLAELAELLGRHAQASVARARRIEIQWQNTSGRTCESHDRRKEGHDHAAEEGDS